MKKIVVTLLSILLLTGCGNKTTKKVEESISNSSNNNNKEVIEDKVYDGLSFTNTSLTTVDGKSTLITTVENKTGSDYNLEFFDILLKDSNDNVVETLLGYVGETIKNGESKRIKSSTDKDISSVIKIEYEVRK